MRPTLALVASSAALAARDFATVTLGSATNEELLHELQQRNIQLVPDSLHMQPPPPPPHPRRPGRAPRTMAQRREAPVCYLLRPPYGTHNGTRPAALGVSVEALGLAAKNGQGRNATRAAALYTVSPRRHGVAGTDLTWTSYWNAPAHTAFVLSQACPSPVHPSILRLAAPHSDEHRTLLPVVHQRDPAIGSYSLRPKGLWMYFAEGCSDVMWAPGRALVAHNRIDAMLRVLMLERACNASCAGASLEQLLLSSAAHIWGRRPPANLSQHVRSAIEGTIDRTQLRRDREDNREEAGGGGGAEGAMDGCPLQSEGTLCLR